MTLKWKINNRDRVRRAVIGKYVVAVRSVDDRTLVWTVRRQGETLTAGTLLDASWAEAQGAAEAAYELQSRYDD